MVTICDDTGVSVNIWCGQTVDNSEAQGECYCGDFIVQWCDRGVFNCISEEEAANKLKEYIDCPKTFFALSDTPSLGWCPSKSILYTYVDPSTGDEKVRCWNLCVLLKDLVENGSACECDCQCDEDCSCTSPCENPWGDKLVWASSTDSTPWSLIEKLYSDCIDFSIKNPGTGNEQVELSCNFQNKLIDTTDGPGSWPSCPNGNGNIVQNWQDWWKVNCPECVQIGTIRLEESQTYDAFENADWFIGLWGVFNNDLTPCSIVKSINYDNGWHPSTIALNGSMQAERDGRYDLDFQVPMRRSQWFRTFRAQLQVVGWPNAGIIIDDSIEGPDFETDDFENAAWDNSPAVNNNNIHGQLLRWLSRYTFWGSRKYYLFAGDCVAIVLKYSTTNMLEESNLWNPDFSIQWLVDGGVTNGQWTWAYFSWHYMPSLIHPVL